MFSSIKVAPASSGVAASGVIATFTVPTSKVAEFIEIAERDAVASRKEPGCIRFDVVQHDDTKFSFYELWATEAALSAHMRTPHFKEWEAFKISNSLFLKKQQISLPLSAPALRSSDIAPQGAVDHIVVQKLIRPLNVEEIAQAHMLQHLIPGILSITCGENLTMRSAGYNYGWSIRFESLEAVHAYVPHREHARFKREVINKLVDRSAPVPAVVLDFAVHAEDTAPAKQEVAARSDREKESLDERAKDIDPAAVLNVQCAARSHLARKKVLMRRQLKRVNVDAGQDLAWAEKVHPLHWDPRLERRGLGWQVQKLNHVGLVCADIGKSVAFYSDVIGLQQIMRPNFDRYGAWFTMGNVELHLTKGTPPTRREEDDTDLITHHMAMEIDPSQVDVVKEKLIAMNVPFRQNLSVPRGDVTVKDGPDKSKFDKRSQLVQFIIRDPDGYYVEVLSGGDSLVDFCFPFINFDDDREVGEAMQGDYEDYSDSHQYSKNGDLDLDLGYKPAPTLPRVAWMEAKSVAWVHRATAKRQAQAGAAGAAVAHRALAELLSSKEPATEVDRGKEARLHARRHVYCDLCQSFTEEQLTEALARCQNDIPLTMELLADIVRTERGGRLTYRPPAFLRNGSKFEISPPVPAPELLMGGGVVADNADILDTGAVKEPNTEHLEERPSDLFKKSGAFQHLDSTGEWLTQIM